MTSRGRNFTERERCKLLDLVQKYKHIIENKCTNAVFTVQKNEAWEHITAEFNSSAEVPRSLKQLNTAYLNLKRTARKNVANENVKRYLERTQDVAGPSQIISLTDETIQTEEISNIIKQFKKDEIADKKGVRETGGGTYTPVLSNVGAQVLAVMGNQVKPLTNNCDSASSYFVHEEDSNIIMVQPPDVMQVQATNDFSLPPTQVPNSTHINVQAKSKIMKNQKKVLKKKVNNNAIKNNYYQRKLESALIEKKNKIIRI